MDDGVFVSRRSVVNLIIAVCLVAVSCSDRESPTSPMSASSAGKATISGTETVSRDRSTVSLAPRSEEGRRTPNPTLTGTPATATPTRTPRAEQVELEGTVGGISGTSFVLMTRSGPVTIQTNPQTVFRRDGNPATFADIVTGERVEVEGARQGDGSVLASRVNIEEEAEERTRTPSATGTATTTATTPLPTRTPTPTRTPEPEEEVERRGTVGSVSGSTFVLMTESGPVMIQTNASTQFRNDGNPASFSDIHPGVEVEVQGVLQPDGSILASRVSLEGR